MAVLLEPVKKTRLYEDISKEILRLMKNGSLKPGDKLPPERELSEQLQVSRTVIREALRSLEAQGYLESKVGGGTFVRTVTVDNMLSPFSVILSQTDKEFEDLIRVRELLEVEAATLAAKHVTKEYAAQLYDILEQMKENAQHGGNPRIDDDNFHNLIAEMSGNKALSMICELCAKLLSDNRQATMEIPGQLDITYSAHKKIADAIISGNQKEAATCMRQHLRNAQKAFDKYHKKAAAS